MSSVSQYTAEQVELIRQLYPLLPATDIAKRLGCLPAAVYRLADRLGISKQPRISERVKSQVIQLHGLGFLDTTIAQRLHLQRRTVTYLRKVLGLRMNIPALLAAKQRGVQQQQESLGLTCLGGGLRALAYQRFALGHGWPKECSPREVQILNLLATVGVPLTKQQITSEIGMRTDLVGCNGSPCYLKSRKSSYTAQLLQRGLLVRLLQSYTVTGQGKGRSQDLYLLSPLAISILQERVRCVTVSL